MVACKHHERNVSNGNVTTDDVWHIVICLFAGVPGKIMNNYCWIMSTYTLPRLWDVSSHHHLHPDHQTPQHF